MTRRMTQPTAAYESLLVYHEAATKDREELIGMAEVALKILEQKPWPGQRAKARELIERTLADVETRGLKLQPKRRTP